MQMKALWEFLFSPCKTWAEFGVSIGGGLALAMLITGMHACYVGRWDTFIFCCIFAPIVAYIIYHPRKK